MLSLIQAWNALWELQTLVKRLTSTAAIVPAWLFSSTTSSYLEGWGRLFSSPANVFLHRHANKGGARFWFFFFLPHLKFLICPVQSFLLLFIPWKIPKATKLGEKRKNLSNECMLCELLHENLRQTQCLTVGVFASQMPTALSRLRSDWNCASLNLIKRLRDAGFGQE